MASASGDTAALARLLAEDGVLYSDGGKRLAALNPIYRRDKIARFLVRKDPTIGRLSAQPARINGSAGFILGERW